MNKTECALLAGVAVRSCPYFSSRLEAEINRLREKGMDIQEGEIAGEYYYWIEPLDDEMEEVS